VCARGWESCSQQIDRFTAFKPRYTAAYVAERLSEIEQAARRPDRDKRSSQQELLRLALKAEALKSLSLWRKLQSHIEEAWSETEWASRLKAAGQGYYRDAGKMKWEACQSLMVSADSFVREHTAELQANQNMGAEFLEAVNAGLQAYQNAYKAFLESQRFREEGTGVKREANNKLYADLNVMFSDARQIFKDDAVKLKQFVFMTLLNQVSGPGTAGLKGFIAGLPEPVDVHPGLELKLLESGKTAQIGEDGAYRFSQVAAGNYTLLVKADGFQTQSLLVVVNTGSFTLLNVSMLKQVEPRPPATEQPDL